MIKDFLRQKEKVLFAGAGVSRRAGLPTWDELVTELADKMEKHEAPVATAMRERAAQGLLPEAFDLLEGSPLVGDAVRYGWLRDALDPPPQPELLHDLLRLPFERFVTTNFDWAIPNAWAHEHTTVLRPADHDRALVSAMYWTIPYIAQIHGSVTVPENMVLSRQQFASLGKRAEYRQFLRYVFTQFDCLFVGFSFNDPAIIAVLEELENTVGAEQRHTHLALIPEGAEPLRARLAQVNVAVRLYDPANDHAALWGGIASVAHDLPPPAILAGSSDPPGAKQPLSMLTTRQMLAAAYARARLAEYVGPVRDQVIDGLIFSVLSDQSGMTVDEVQDRVAIALRASSSEVARISSEGLARLAGIGMAVRRGNQWIALDLQDDPTSADLDLLADGVLDRLTVRENLRPTPKDRELVTTTLETLVIRRGLQLGAQLAGVNSPWGVPLDTIRESMPSNHDPERRDSIVAAIRNLLVEPSAPEAHVLAEMGRLGFGLDVLLNQVHSAVLNDGAFPNRLYLDATLALPLLVQGYPLRPAYRSALSRLQAAVRSHGHELTVIVGGPFLNEIIRHRGLAKREVEEQGLEEPSRLQRYFTMIGQESGNVFVSAYASAVSRVGNRIPFASWLAQQAPYESERELARHLERMGIGSTSRELPDGERLRRLHQIEGALQVSYSARKAPILIEHEAQQLLELEELGLTAPRTVFVTADAALRRAISEHSELMHLSRFMLSQVAFVGLVDFLVGVHESDESVARLFWGVRRIEEKDDARVALRSYFTDLALTEYRSAIDFDLESLVSRYTSEVEVEAAERGRSFGEMLADDVGEAERFLDRKADSFYREMREEITRRDRGL